MFFMILWILFPFIWFILLKLSYLDIRKISICNIVFLGIFIYQYIGLPILFFGLDEFRADEVSNKELLFQVFTFTSCTITMMLIGFLFGSRLFGKIDSKYLQFKLTLLSPHQFRRLFFITLICFFVLFLYLRKVGFQNLALLSALGVIESKASDVLRSAMGNAFEGKYHWYYLFMNRILLFCCYTLFVNYLTHKKNKNIYIFYLTLFVSAFSLTIATEKGPLAYFVISLFLVYTLVKRKGLIPINRFLQLSAFLIMMLISFYLAFMKVENLNQAFFSIFSRTLTGQIQPAYHYLEFFPAVQDFLYGRSMTNPMGIFPFDSYNISLEVMAWYSQDQDKMGIVGSMPTIFWGELYANFGFLGILIISPIVGLIVYAIDRLFILLPRNSLTIALYIWMCMYFFNLCGTGLSSFIFDIYPIFVFISYLWVMGVKNFTFGLKSK